MLSYLQLRRRYRLPVEFPPKKLRNNTTKVLETRRQALEQYLQAFVQLCQRSCKPLPQCLLDFLQIAAHVPKVSSIVYNAHDRLNSCFARESGKTPVQAATHKPIVGFASKEPFLFESSHALQVSNTGLPDIITQATLQCFYNPWTPCSTPEDKFSLLYFYGWPTSCVIPSESHWAFINTL